ncbi:hypothetical protein F7725_008132 [Dissostichus mawsoni]|uniref:Uncharacterized protein n=1 Tax=Dissostichus mawsoni TaxID=36200 RepID=A0A7J5Y899_DISMA|nr:hypothetical protein F7725_008132 [Dissostichus mawsoni]
MYPESRRQRRPQTSTEVVTIHVQSNMPLSTLGVNSVSGSVFNSNPASENNFQLPRTELNSAEGNHIEQSSSISDSTVITIHDTPSIGDT